MTGPALAEARAAPTRRGPEVSIVVPVSSPEADVGRLVREYSRELDLLPYAYEFVFVLDGVAGGVLADLEELARAEAPVKVVTLQGGGFGESVAMSAGVQKAAGELIVTAPQYLQVEPREVRKLLSELEAGYDFVTPWRRPRVDPWLNRMQSMFFNWCMRLLTGMPFHDLNCYFRGMRRQVMEEITVYGDLYRFLPIMAHRQGFRVKEVDVAHREEVGRRGFFGLGVYVRRLLDILAVTFLTRYTSKPLRFFGLIGLVLIVLGLAVVAEPLYQRLVGDRGLLERPLFLVGILLASFGVQFIGFGLVGEIIIFTQAPRVRDYRIDRFYDNLAQAPPDRPPAFSSRSLAAVRPLGPGEEGRWDGFLESRPDATLFHGTPWRRVVEAVFPHVPHYLVAESDGRIRGVLPLFRVRSPFLGRTLISVPFGVYGGIVAGDREAELALLRHAVSMAERMRIRYLELRHLEERKLGLAASDLYVTFSRDLPKDPAQCLGMLPKKARAEARRGREAGLRFQEGCTLDVFFSLFARNKHGLGSPTLPLRMFEAIQRELGESVVLHAVLLPDGTPAAAVMSFRFRDTLMAYYSGALKEHERLGLNNFLYWQLLQWAAANGMGRFDFGRSRAGTGSAAFKKHMGFEPTSLHYQYHLVGRAGIPVFHPGNPRLDLPRHLWRLLPPPVATRLGGWLSRYLP